jgi:hypothetical protein
LPTGMETTSSAGVKPPLEIRRAPVFGSAGQ